MVNQEIILNRIKPMFGYWDTTHYPIGGSFRRAGADGESIEKILRLFEHYKGCNMEVLLLDGRKAAVNSQYCE